VSSSRSTDEVEYAAFFAPPPSYEEAVRLYSPFDVSVSECDPSNANWSDVKRPGSALSIYSDGASDNVASSRRVPSALDPELEHPLSAASDPPVAAADTEAADANDKFSCHIISSCCVLWLCGCVFGCIAYLVAGTSRVNTMMLVALLYAPWN